MIKAHNPTSLQPFVYNSRIMKLFLIDCKRKLVTMIRKKIDRETIDNHKRQTNKQVVAKV